MTLPLTLLVALVADLFAIIAIAAMYFARHQRRDLLLAYVALNSGVLAAAAVLTSASVGAGLGLGLFGILSIIRLRSDPITQEEIAYYFTALALGLVAGLHPEPVWLTPVVAAGLVFVMYLADHPRLLGSNRHQLVTLDLALTDETLIRTHIEQRWGVDVTRLRVQTVDLVRDLTIVDVRFRVRDEQVPPLLSHPDSAEITSPIMTPAPLAQPVSVGASAKSPLMSLAPSGRATSGSDPANRGSLPLGTSSLTTSSQPSWPVSASRLPVPKIGPNPPTIPTTPSSATKQPASPLASR